MSLRYGSRAGKESSKGEIVGNVWRSAGFVGGLAAAAVVATVLALVVQSAGASASGAPGASRLITTTHGTP